MKDNITITAQVLDTNLWSLYNDSLQFEYYNKGTWNMIGANLTDEQGMTEYTFNTTGLPKGRVKIRVSFSGSPNYIANNSVTYFEHGKADALVLPLDLLLLMTFTNQSLRISPLIIIGIISASGFLITILIIVTVKKKG